MDFKKQSFVVALWVFLTCIQPSAWAGYPYPFGQGGYFFYHYTPLQVVPQRVFLQSAPVFGPPLPVVPRSVVYTRTFPVVNYYPQQPLPPQNSIHPHRDFWSQARHDIDRDFNSHHVSIVRGVIAGAGVAGGMYLIKKSPAMQRHPLVRHITQGALIGTGVGYTLATKSTLLGLAIGAAAGEVYHVLSK